MSNQQIHLWHKQVFDLFYLMREYRIIASYVGPFNRSVLLSLAQNLRSSLWFDITQQKKFFKIFIELASNIANYSIERQENTGSGSIIINEYRDHFTINAGNLIDQKSKNYLIRHLNLINSLDRKSLRKYKRYLLRQPPNKKDSGNIGLVQVSLISRYPLNYKFFSVKIDKNLYYFYIISVRLDKKLTL